MIDLKFTFFNMTYYPLDMTNVKCLDIARTSYTTKVISRSQSQSMASTSIIARHIPGFPCSKGTKPRCFFVRGKFKLGVEAKGGKWSARVYAFALSLVLITQDAQISAARCTFSAAPLSLAD